MAKREPTYRIDPIGPEEVGPRLAALIDRLEPSLPADDVVALRSLVDAGDHAAAFGWLDTLTDDGTISVETATLVELVLLGQAIRTG